VVVLEEGALLAELVEGGGVLLGDRVGAEAVPDEQDDMRGLAGGAGGGGGEAKEERAGEEREGDAPAIRDRGFVGHGGIEAGPAGEVKRV